MLTVIGKVKSLMPYAAIVLMLPGGFVIAPLLWLYRRQGVGSLGDRLAAAWPMVFRGLENNGRPGR
jgi:hypothetical protein